MNTIDVFLKGTGQHTEQMQLYEKMYKLPKINKLRRKKYSTIIESMIKITMMVQMEYFWKWKWTIMIGE